jgi:hypothetical protein
MVGLLCRPRGFAFSLSLSSAPPELTAIPVCLSSHATQAQISTVATTGTERVVDQLPIGLVADYELVDGVDDAVYTPSPLLRQEAPLKDVVVVEGQDATNLDLWTRSLGLHA